MLQLSAQASHGGQVFLLIWGVAALAMGAAFGSKKGSTWVRAVVVSGLQGWPFAQARAQNFSGLRAIGALLATAGLIGIGAAIVMLSGG
ncbi:MULTISPECIES: hypothetical protein [Streptomyces]|uniref:hypothetical protein n=1 Tax=Streptomyces TaxID=1883 RepID=UPI00201D158E|nr:hypothetical protein [Streptomyces panaciradicis]MCL6675358.1 hypothetical protein [Streptomyces panaciradicis]